MGKPVLEVQSGDRLEEEQGVVEEGLELDLSGGRAIKKWQKKKEI